MNNNSLSLFAKDEESQRVGRATNRTMLVFFQVCCLVIDACKFEGDDDQENLLYQPYEAPRRN